jgi:aryl-alcohol dehydrogenase-like predicted oxidoreductase
VETRALGATGIEVGVVGLGAWQLGNTTMWDGPDETESLRIVDEAIELGCTLFDTAPGYGEGRSEELLGRALRDRRDRVVICSKFGHTADGRSDFSAGAIEPSARESLRRLQTDYLDILLLHSPPDELMDGGAPQYAELERLRSLGMIRAYGVSLDWDRALKRVLDTTRSGVVEVLFNAFHQDPAPGVARAGSEGVGVIAKVPLDSGWLAGRYGRASTFSGVRSRWTAEDIARRADQRGGGRRDAAGRDGRRDPAIVGGARGGCSGRLVGAGAPVGWQASGTGDPQARATGERNGGSVALAATLGAWIGATSRRAPRSRPPSGSAGPCASAIVWS